MRHPKSEEFTLAFADLPQGVHAEHVRNHWWWRPGWRVGREFFTWHLTFYGEQDLCRLVHRHQQVLGGLPGVDPIPPEWLHLTVQGIGFTDEVSVVDLDEILGRARHRLAGIKPFTLTFDTAFVADEAIVLPPREEDKIVELRSAIREVIGSAWGVDNVPEDATRYRPHVSVAYLTDDRGSAPYITAVASARPEPAVVVVRQISLIALNRDDRMYKWRTHATASLKNDV